MKKRLLFILILLILFQSVQADTVQKWLYKMSQAMEQLNYRGHFVYLCDKNLQAMYVQHWQDEEGLTESLFTLTGKPTKIIRQGSDLIVINHQGERTVLQKEQQLNLSPLRRINPDWVLENYRVVLGGQERIADQNGIVLRFQPKDNYRYTYHMVLDQATALPLALSVFEKGRLLSRLMFIDIEIEYQHYQTVSKKWPTLSQSRSRWRFKPPSGFYLIHYHKQHDQEQFVFFDGLSSISIYFEPLRGKTGLNDQTKIEFVHVLARTFKKYQIIAVGEVPIQSLNNLFSTLR